MLSFSVQQWIDIVSALPEANDTLAKELASFALLDSSVKISSQELSNHFPFFVSSLSQQDVVQRLQEKQQSFFLLCEKRTDSLAPACWILHFCPSVSAFLLYHPAEKNQRVVSIDDKQLFFSFLSQTKGFFFYSFSHHKEEKKEEISQVEPSSFLYADFKATLFKLLLFQKKELGSLLVFGLLLGLFSLVTPIVMQSMVNVIAFGNILQPLVILSMFLGIGLVAAAVFQSFEYYLIELISRRIFKTVLTAFWEKFSTLQLSSLQGVRRSEISNRLFEAVSIQKLVSVLLFEGLTLVIKIGAGLLLLAFYHPIFFVFDVMILFSLLIIFKIYLKKGSLSSIQESKKKYKIIDWMQQFADKSPSFKNEKAAPLLQLQLQKLSLQYFQAREKHFTTVFRQYIGFMAIQVLVNVSLVLVGGWLVIHNKLSLGQLVAAEIVMTLVTASIIKMGKLFEKVFDLVASFDKVKHVLDLESVEKTGKAFPTQEREALTLRIQIQTPTRKRINLELCSGEKMALFAPEPDGKTFLSQSLLGLHAVDGSISLNQTPLQQFSITGLHNNIERIADFELTEASVFENLRMCNPSLTEAQAWKALEYVSLQSFFQNSPEGLQTKTSTILPYFTTQQLHLLHLSKVWCSSSPLILIDCTLDILSPEAKEKVLRSFSELPTWKSLLVFTRKQDIAERMEKVCFFSETSEERMFS